MTNIEMKIDGYTPPSNPDDVENPEGNEGGSPGGRMPIFEKFINQK